ncbi:MAG: hypothetical protein ABSC19_15175 [Syntrophorhabdales bacterium]
MLEGFAKELGQAGYAEITARRHIGAAEHLLYWTEWEGVPISDLAESLSVHPGFKLARSLQDLPAPAQRARPFAGQPLSGHPQNLFERHPRASENLLPLSTNESEANSPSSLASHLHLPALLLARLHLPQATLASLTSLKQL